jgi:hypothetical protein
MRNLSWMALLWWTFRSEYLAQALATRVRMQPIQEPGLHANLVVAKSKHSRTEFSNELQSTGIRDSCGASQRPIPALGVPTALRQVQICRLNEIMRKPRILGPNERMQKRWPQRKGALGLCRESSTEILKNGP